MKKLLIFSLMSLFLTGCAVTKVQTNEYEKYLPWKPYAQNKEGVTYFVEPSTKKQVANGVYVIWTKNNEQKWENIIFQEVVDCNTEETASSKAVLFQNGKAYDQIKLNQPFNKTIPGTIGYALIKYICK